MVEKNSTTNFPSENGIPGTESSNAKARDKAGKAAELNPRCVSEAKKIASEDQDLGAPSLSRPSF